MHALEGDGRMAVESRFGWTLYERGEDAWAPIGEVESGDEAERWVRLTSAPSCGTFTS